MGMCVWIGRIHKTHIQKGKKTFLMIPIIGTNSVRHLMNVKDFICLTGTNELSRMLKTLLWSGLSLIRSMSLKVTDRCTLSAFLNLCMNNYWRELNKTHKDVLPLPPPNGVMITAKYFMMKTKQQRNNSYQLTIQSHHQYLFLPKQAWRQPQRQHVVAIL